MSRRATLSLAALLAATVVTGSVAIVGIAQRSPVPAAPAAPVVRSAPATPSTPPVLVTDHDTEEED